MFNRIYFICAPKDWEMDEWLNYNDPRRADESRLEIIYLTEGEVKYLFDIGMFFELHSYCDGIMNFYESCEIVGIVKLEMGLNALKEFYDEKEPLINKIKKIFEVAIQYDTEVIFVF